MSKAFSLLSILTESCLPPFKRGTLFDSYLPTSLFLQKPDFNNTKFLSTLEAGIIMAIFWKLAVVPILILWLAALTEFMCCNETTHVKLFNKEMHYYPFFF